jgi:hypothetical protein
MPPQPDGTSRRRRANLRAAAGGPRRPVQQGTSHHRRPVPPPAAVSPQPPVPDDSRSLLLHASPLDSDEAAHLGARRRRWEIPARTLLAPTAPCGDFLLDAFSLCLMPPLELLRHARLNFFQSWARTLRW